jgi:hypothetical protein
MPSTADGAGIKLGGGNWPVIIVIHNQKFTARIIAKTINIASSIRGCNFPEAGFW